MLRLCMEDKQKHMQTTLLRSLILNYSREMGISREMLNLIPGGWDKHMAELLLFTSQYALLFPTFHTWVFADILGLPTFFTRFSNFLEDIFTSCEEDDSHTA